MLAQKASRTALSTAYLRAAHQLIDAQPKILHDPIAVKILGPNATEYIKHKLERFNAPEKVALRARVVLRSRYTEDRLLESTRRGNKQYVILGAGLDTFAYRQPEWAKALRIFEFDLAATQSVKRDLLLNAGITLPDNTTLAPIDFEKDRLAECLQTCGVSPEEPAFFSWLGVSMYLNESAVDSTLKVLGAFPVGSEAVLTFLHPDDLKRATGKRMVERVSELGEHFISSFDQVSLSNKLRHHGFSTVDFLSHQEAKARYFLNGRCSLPAPKRPGLAAAIRL